MSRASWTTQARGNADRFRRICTSRSRSHRRRSPACPGPAMRCRIGVDQIGPIDERGVAAIVVGPVAGRGRQDEVAGTPEVERRPGMIQDGLPRLDPERGGQAGIEDPIRRPEEPTLIEARRLALVHEDIVDTVEPAERGLEGIDLPVRPAREAGPATENRPSRSGPMTGAAGSGTGPGLGLGAFGGANGLEDLGLALRSPPAGSR